MPHWHFLHSVGTICTSSTMLQTPGTPLQSNFAHLNVDPLHQHLNFIAFHQYNCFGAMMLKNTFCFMVLLLVLEMQLRYLPHVPYTPQYLDQDQTKMVWKINPLRPPPYCLHPIHASQINENLGQGIVLRIVKFTIF